MCVVVFFASPTKKMIQLIKNMSNFRDFLSIESKYMDPIPLRIKKWLFYRKKIIKK